MIGHFKFIDLKEFIMHGFSGYTFTLVLYIVVNFIFNSNHVYISPKAFEKEWNFYFISKFLTKEESCSVYIKILIIYSDSRGLCLLWVQTNIDNRKQQRFRQSVNYSSLPYFSDFTDFILKDIYSRQSYYIFLY